MSTQDIGARGAEMNANAGVGSAWQDQTPWGVQAMVERAMRWVQRYGLAGSLLRAAMAMARRITPSIYLKETHVWYRLDLAQERREITLPEGFELISAGPTDLPLLNQLPAVGLYQARRRLASNADLWIVREGGQAAFCCWTFRSRTPVEAARDGWLALPPAIVCLEDSVTSPLYRGRGIAPAAWTGIARALMQEGAVAMVTKIEERNTASRRAVEKIGFRTVAFMRRVRVLARSHVKVRLQAGEEGSTFLVTHLAR
ncbi:MAG TPA: GNAT family N-acetyltransferase [Candidatus Methylomirabilis sp.]|nr:GNAT family N-acetyltransferase [Candidatus Methylomirabilis sp.]